MKKLSYCISRNGESPSKRTQRNVKSTYRAFWDRVGGIVKIAHQVVDLAAGGWLDDLSDLKHYPPLVEKIIDQAEKRVFEGILLPADEKKIKSYWKTR